MKSTIILIFCLLFTTKSYAAGPAFQCNFYDSKGKDQIGLGAMFKVVDLNRGRGKTFGAAMPDDRGSDVFVMFTGEAYMFIETTLTGNMIMTSIFVDNLGRPVIAVTSRHMHMSFPGTKDYSMDSYIFGQYVGDCFKR